MKRKIKKQNPVRYRAARADATIAGIARRIEKNFKLPGGSVCLILPSGRRAHFDGSIDNLLKRWNYS